MLINKKKCQVDFDVVVTDSVTIKKRKDRQILGPCQKKAMEQEDNGDSSCCWSTWNGPQRLREQTEGTVNQRRNQHLHLEHSLNTQKSSVDLRRDALT